MSDSVYFLKRVFLVVSYSSLYLPSIIISLLSPPFFFLQLRIRMYLFKAGLPQSHFVTHLSDSETPTGKKEKKKLKKFFLAFIQFQNLPNSLLQKTNYPFSPL